MLQATHGLMTEHPTRRLTENLVTRRGSILGAPSVYGSIPEVLPIVAENIQGLSSSSS